MQLEPEVQESIDALVEGFVGLPSPELNELVVTSYSEKNRHYHTVHHLDWLYKVAIKWKKALFTDEEWKILCGAILFHDIIYNAKREDNEKQSATIARTWINNNLTGYGIILRNVERLILDMDEPGVSFLNDFFQDIDMSILGGAGSLYPEYQEAVRKEYSTAFTPEQYNMGRKSFLVKLLRRKSIFRTNIFFLELEQNAIRNIAAEIASL